MKCGAKALLDPLWDLDLDKFINTAGLRGVKFRAKACLDPLSNLDRSIFK